MPAARRRTRSIDFNFGNLQGDFALMGIEPNGVISYTVPDRADFDARLAQSVNGRPIEDQGGDRYRLHIDADHEGWSGIILISGQGPFPQDVVAPQVGARGPTWQQQFLSMAAERGWRVEMVWYESINRGAATGSSRHGRSSGSRGSKRGGSARPIPCRTRPSAAAHRPCGTPSRRPP